MEKKFVKYNLDVPRVFFAGWFDGTDHHALHRFMSVYKLNKQYCLLAQNVLIDKCENFRQTCLGIAKNKLLCEATTKVLNKTMSIMNSNLIRMFEDETLHDFATWTQVSATHPILDILCALFAKDMVSHFRSGVTEYS